MRLMWRRGEAFGFVKGRCRATNKCAYCRILGVVETAEMLNLDALEYAPQLLLTLTAREHLTRPDTYLHLKAIRRSCRKLWPSIEWFVQVEFQKRGALHMHLLVKGVPVDQAGAFYERATGIWCERVDAIAGPYDRQDAGGQSVQPINAAEAVVRYLQKELAHGLKQEQAPPLGWRGHRTSQTRGYLVRPAAVMREEARASLRRKRALHRVLADVPEADADLVEELTDWLLGIDAEKAWCLAVVHHGTIWEFHRDRGLKPLRARERQAFVETLEAAPQAAQAP